jgi:hypothetical protein
MWFTVFIIALVGILVTAGIVLAVRHRRSGDYDDRLDPRDQPGRAHNEGQAAAHVGLAVRGSSHMGPF